MKILIPLLLVFGSLFADESLWNPWEHPAQINRSFILFTRPAREMDLSFEVGGKLLIFPLQEGQVTQKKVIAELDSTLTKIDLDAQNTRILAIENEISQAQNTIHSANIQVVFDENEFNRAKALSDKKILSQQELALYQHKQELSGVQLQSRILQLQALHLKLKEAQLQRQRVQELLDRHQIIPPQGWTISHRYLEPGSHVNPGQAIARCVDLHQLAADLWLSEEEIHALKQNTNLKMICKKQDKPIATRIHYISPNFDPITKKRRVEFRCDGEDMPERSGGIELNLSLSWTHPSKALMVPRQFISFKYDQGFVQPPQGDEIPVRVLSQNQQQVIIDSSKLEKNIQLKAYPQP